MNTLDIQLENVFTLDQIVPFFQPIFNLNNGHLYRYECLSRIISDNENIYLPSDFLHLVAQSESDTALTKHVLQLSSAYCKPRNMRYSINLFNSDVGHPEIIEFLKSIDDDSIEHLVGAELGFDHACNNPQMLSSLMKKLPKLHITIDDVHLCEIGLTGLIELGVNAIKLRCKAVMEYAQTNEGIALLDDIKQHCLDHKCALIVERIETEQELDKIKQLGFEFGQGFHLSQPSPEINL